MIDQVALRRLMGNGQSLASLISGEQGKRVRLEAEQVRLGEAIQAHRNVAPLAVQQGNAAMDGHAKALNRLELQAQAVVHQIQQCAVNLALLTSREVAELDRRLKAEAIAVKQARANAVEEVSKHVEELVRVTTRARLGSDFERAILQRLADDFGLRLGQPLSPATTHRRRESIAQIFGVHPPEPPAAA